MAARTGQGPTPRFGDFKPLVLDTARRMEPATVMADAGRDSEASRELCRDESGMQSLIPPEHGRPSSTEPAGRYRRPMQRYIHLGLDGQRCQVETGISMTKKRLPKTVLARTY